MISIKIPSTSNLRMVLSLICILLCLTVLYPTPAMAQDKDEDLVTGKVTDVKGNALPGTKVYFKGTKYATLCDSEGFFKIHRPTGEKNPTIGFYYIGMKRLEIQLKGRKELDIKLSEGAFSTDEVIVTGVFNKPKESFTGAATKITQKELKMAGNRNIIKSITNLDPSFLVVDNNLGSDPNRLPEIRVRGFSAIPSVTDLKNGTKANLVTPLFILDGFEITLDQMMDLNNDEIESITLLKDASATAMYGSRGANGVVVITSVKPKSGKLKFTYNSNLNLEIPDLSSYQLLNAKEKLELEKSAGLYNSTDLRTDLELKEIYKEKLRAVEAGVDVDWLRIPVRMGVGQNHHLGMNGGDDHFRYSMGLSYNHIAGAMKGSDRKTTSLDVRLMYISDKFSFNNSTYLGNSNFTELPKGLEFYNYARMNPYFQPFDKDGVPYPFFERNAFWGQQVDNPEYIRTLKSFSTISNNNFRNSFSITYNPFEFLQITSSIGLGKSFGKNEHFVSPFHPDEIAHSSKEESQISRGKRAYSSNESTNWDWSTTFSFYKTFGMHSINFGANYSMYSRSDEGRNIRVKGYVNDVINSLNMSTSYDQTHPDSHNNLSRSVGLAATLNYVFNNRIYVDGSYRLDGGSCFGSLSRWAPFYSLGTGWTLSNEPWMKDLHKYISHLKVRYSFGVSGSQRFSPWQSIGTYTFMPLAYHGGFIAYKTGLENRNLKWQSTYQHNTGADLSLFNGLISISFNHYYKLTKDAITTVALPMSNGVENCTSNEGDILNKGYDLDFSFYAYRNTEKNISLNFRVGLSHNENRIVKLSQSMKDFMNSQSGTAAKYMKYILKEGNSIDAIYAIRSYGVDPSTGKVVYKYKNGTQGYQYSMADQVPCGDRIPKLDVRLSTSLQWKKLSMYMGFTLKMGGYVYNDTYASKVENVDFHNNVDKRVLSERWKQYGDNTHFFGLREREYYITDRYIQKENSLFCHNLNISYDCTNKWTRKIGFKGLYFNGSLGNVFYISTIKQERGTGYPYAIQPSFGLTCSF